jgi:hypothetical protein
MSADAREIFLVDQHEAAADEQRDNLLAFAAENGLEPDATLHHPVVRRFTERLLLWRLNHLIGDCEHLAGGTPQLSYWTPFEPRLLRCETCMTALKETLANDSEHPCNHCGQTASTHALDGVRIAVGSTQILAGVCSTCLALGGTT